MVAVVASGHWDAKAQDDEGGIACGSSFITLLAAEIPLKKDAEKGALVAYTIPKAHIAIMGQSTITGRGLLELKVPGEKLRFFEVDRLSYWDHIVKCLD